MKIKQRKVTREQRQYIRGIIQNLALQRWQDQEIVDYLNNEKNITLSRSAVTRIRIRIERQAEKWYFELRESRYRYVAMFKDRIDSCYHIKRNCMRLLSASTSTDAEREHEQRPEVKIRAISELHAIEVTLFTMWKQLPNLYVNNNITVNHAPVSVRSATRAAEERGYESTQIPPVDYPDERERFDKWTLEGKPMSAKYIMEMKSKYGIPSLATGATHVQCPDCKRWFENENFKVNHMCLERERERGEINYGRDNMHMSKRRD